MTGLIEQGKNKVEREGGWGEERGERRHITQ